VTHSRSRKRKRPPHDDDELAVSGARHAPCPALGQLRRAIARLGVEVATRRSGLSPSAVASYLARRRRPNVDAAFKLLDGLGIALESWRPFQKDHTCHAGIGHAGGMAKPTEYKPSPRHFDNLPDDVYRKGPQRGGGFVMQLPPAPADFTPSPSPIAKSQPNNPPGARAPSAPWPKPEPYSPEPEPTGLSKINERAYPFTPLSADVEHDEAVVRGAMPPPGADSGRARRVATGRSR
jgi:hypothetical protein